MLLETYLMLTPTQIRYIRDYIVYLNINVVAYANEVSPNTVRKTLDQARKKTNISKNIELAYKLHNFEMRNKISYINNLNLNTARAAIL